jgi:CBS-domain-containing membrane protein
VHKAAWSWLGAFVGIAVTGLVAQYALPSDVPSFFAAEGAAATLIFALPDLPTGTNHHPSPLLCVCLTSELWGDRAAQPRNMIGGGALSSLLAVAFQKAFASTSLTWLAGALSVATAIAAMAITGTHLSPSVMMMMPFRVSPPVRSSKVP